MAIDLRSVTFRVLMAKLVHLILSHCVSYSFSIIAVEIIEILANV